MSKHITMKLSKNNKRMLIVTKDNDIATNIEVIRELANLKKKKKCVCE